MVPYYMETIFGLLGLQHSMQFNSGTAGIAEAIDLGLQFLKSASDTMNEEPNTNLDDTYVLSLLVFFYSSLKHKEADKMLTRLKARAVFLLRWNILDFRVGIRPLLQHRIEKEVYLSHYGVCFDDIFH